MTYLYDYLYSVSDMMLLCLGIGVVLLAVVLAITDLFRR